jgi:plastocyanin
MFKRGSIALLISLAACGGSTTIGGPDPGTGGDAATNPGPGSTPGGGVTATVKAVTCPTSGTMPMVTAAPADETMAYMPDATTVSVNGIVQFAMPPEHNVVPNPIKPSDPGLQVDFGATTCLQFTSPGTYSFICKTHSFAGTVTVQ